MTEIWSRTCLVVHASLRSQLCKPPRRTNSMAHGLGFPSSESIKLQLSAAATVEHKELEKKHVDGDIIGSLTGDIESAEDSDEEVDARERLRRARISKANKGNTPWNKGRKHSAETIRRIRERTRLAMQNPKVKMKLVNFGHAQSEKTKAKIGLGVRMGWQRRRQRLMVQETCAFEWQNLIAEASRKGCICEQDLLWDSYKILDEQLKNDWLKRVKQRKSTPRLAGTRRAPKSAEQKRKISEAIAAKWADPAYRERVHCGLAKYHGTSVGGVRKTRKEPTGLTHSTRRSALKRKVTDVGHGVVSDTRSPLERLRLRTINKPKYKDPLMSSKLEMIKSIRAQRVAADSMKIEAIERARLLIAEAEKAAKALEVAATKSPVAHSSLTQTRELIAEAIQFIESIGGDQLMSNVTTENSFLGVTASEVVNENGEDNGFRLAMPRAVNRHQSLSPTGIDKLAPRKLAPLLEVNGKEQRIPQILSNQSQISGNHSQTTFNFGEIELQLGSSNECDPLELNEIRKRNCLPSPMYGEDKVHGVNANDRRLSKPLSIHKKWVRGKLVEVCVEA